MPARSENGSSRIGDGAAKIMYCDGGGSDREQTGDEVGLVGFIPDGDDFVRNERVGVGGIVDCSVF